MMNGLLSVILSHPNPDTPSITDVSSGGALDLTEL